MTKRIASDEYEQKSMALHPFSIFLTLVLAGVTMLFLAFSAAYVYTRFQNEYIPTIKLPRIFILNTLILLGSSFTMHKANIYYKRDDTTNYQIALLVTIVLSFIFLVLQFFGWRELFGQELFVASNTMTSYLYVISGLHFMHVIAGLPFLILFLGAAIKRMKEPVSVLVYFSDPEKRLKLRLLTIYWHFLDGLWIYLVIFFLLNYLF